MDNAPSWISWMIADRTGLAARDFAIRAYRRMISNKFGG
jgi:hypothetical protein